MNIFFIIISFCTISLFTLGCKAGKSAEQRQQATQDFKLLAYQKLFGDLDYKYNADSSAVICIKKTQPAYGTTNLHFLVYNFTEQKFIYEDKVGFATVSWHGNDTIKVEKVPGIVQAGKEHKPIGYLLDIRDQTKISLGNEVDQP